MMMDLKVLLVEDDLATRVVLEHQIRSRGYDVTACEDASTALAAYQQTFYPLLVMDLGLPDMDGTELCRHIRALPQGKYSLILIISARKEPADIQTALEAGADDYLIKPVDLQFLDIRFIIIARQLQNLLHRKRAEEELLAYHNQLEKLVKERTLELSRAVTEAKRLNQQLRQEINDRERAEELARKLVTAVETIPLGVTITDLEGTILYVNPAEAKMHGYTIEEVLGKDISVFISPEQRNPLSGEQIGTMGNRLRESLNIRKDGSRFPVSLISSVVRSPHGQAIAIVTTCEDIAERKRAEQALRTSEQQYRLLAENVADGIGIIRKGKWIFANAALCSTFGSPPEHLVGIEAVTLYPDAYKAKASHIHQQLETARASVQWQILEFPLSKDGRGIWIESRHSHIMWESQPAILVTVRDITTRKVKERESQREKQQLRKELHTLRATMKDRYRFGGIIGKSQVMQDVYELILNASAVDDNVVIYGESGTGKELIALTIHQLSKRKKNAFIAVNCGAIPETLFEDEAFGHRKGAFTGAYTNTPGFFEAARKGSLFLDEVGELNPSMQVKLLRALGGGDYTPVGSHTVKKSDVRIIAATNKNLKEHVSRGEIREDFFYRIHVIAITVPPLRERKEDIPLLIDHFLKQYDEYFRYSDLPAEVLQHLYAYDWPGNVRELENTLKRYVTTKHLDFIGTLKSQAARQIPGQKPEILPENLPLHEAVAAYEKRLILNTLDRYHWNKTKTAKKLGMTRQSLLRRLDKYGIKPDDL